MDHVECVVIGAGIIGLAVARALALAGHEVLILESEKTAGSITSSRNSGVIHAGIYYKKDSLKARCCIEGRERLYDYADERGIPHRRCGKLIVAVNEAQTKSLLDIKQRAEANGVHDLALLSREDIMAREPVLNTAAALLSPSTGIVDVHALMLAYLGDAQDNGAMLALNCPVENASFDRDRFIVKTGGVDEMTLSCRFLVNAAGLSAQHIAGRISGLPAASIPGQKLAKGNYFSLSKPPPFQMLIYPVPEPGGLGVHATLNMAGRVTFGPDVEWVETINYHVDPSRADHFYQAIRRYWPGLPDGTLQPDYAGIRPKLSGPGMPDGDFVVSGPADHGLPGLVNLYGIESPGLTSSLALADYVRQALETG